MQSTICTSCNRRRPVQEEYFESGSADQRKHAVCTVRFGGEKTGWKVSILHSRAIQRQVALPIEPNPRFTLKYSGET
jgi:hypothetical protein